MKKEFFGFYDPTEVEIESAWNEGVFVFDANALLNLYRYSEPTREDFFKALNNLEEKLFMPYQVGFEFHSNKNTVIKGLKSLFDSIPNAINELLKAGGKFDSIFNVAKRHPSIQVDAFQKLKEEFIQKIKDELENQYSSHPDFSKDDTVLERLTILYENKVGKPFTEEQLDKIYKEGEVRYKKEMPPGFKDLDSKKDLGNQRIYGDLIIWKQLIEYAKDKKKPIILITDDRKEDWWTKEGGETIRPRQELIKEFFDQSGIRILIYSSDRFLKFAKDRRLIDEVADDSISEVREIRKEDESLASGSIALNNSIYGTYIPHYKALDSLNQYSVFGTPGYVSPYLINSGLITDRNGLITLNPQKSNTLVEDLIRSQYPSGVAINDSYQTYRDYLRPNEELTRSVMIGGEKASLGEDEIKTQSSGLTTDDLTVSNGKKKQPKKK